jgi:hypothetical protein
MLIEDLWSETAQKLGWADRVALACTCKDLNRTLKSLRIKAKDDAKRALDECEESSRWPFDHTASWDRPWAASYEIDIKLFNHWHPFQASTYCDYARNVLDLYAYSTRVHHRCYRNSAGMFISSEENYKYNRHVLRGCKKAIAHTRLEIASRCK